MPYYLSRYVGTGTHGDPCRPVGSEQPGWSAIDLRADGGASAEGAGLNACLLHVPDDAGGDGRLDVVGLDPDDTLGPGLAGRLNARLRTGHAPGRLRNFIARLLLDPPANGWRPLLPAGARYEIHLGGLLWAQPVLAGGTIVATDAFGRPDENPIGAPWATANGCNAMQISGGTLFATVNNIQNAAWYTGATWPDDQYSTYTVAALGAQTNQGPVARGSDATFRRNHYIAIMASTGQMIRKVLEDIETTLATVTAGAFVVGDTVRLEAQGPTLRYYRNGVQATGSPATDTAIPSGRPGIWSFRTNTQADLWEGGYIDVAGILIAGADAVRVQLGFNPSPLIAIAAADAIAVPTPEMTTQDFDLVLALDTVAVGVTESTATLARLAVQDPLISGLVDTGGVGALTTGSVDQLGVVLADLLRVLVTALAADALAVAAQDAALASALVALVVTETVVAGLADLGAALVVQAVAIGAADGVGVGLTDAPRGLAVFLAGGDVTAAALVDALAGTMAVRVRPVDAFAVVLGSPATQGLTLVASSDAARAGFADFATVSLAAPAVIILGSDAVRCTAADSASGFDASFNGESLALTLTDLAAIAVLAGATPLGSVDGAATGLLDVGAVSVVGSALAVGTTEIFGVGAADIAALLDVDLRTAETVAASLGDLAAVTIAGLVAIAAQDAVSAALADGAFGVAIALVTGDTTGIGATDFPRATARALGADAMSVGLGDLAAAVADVALVSFTAADAVAVSALDDGAAVVLSNSIDVADALAAVAADAGLVAVLSQEILAADAVPVMLDDQTGLFATLAAADLATAALADLAGLSILGFVALAAADAVIVRLDDVNFFIADFTVLASTDTVALRLAESGLHVVDVGDVALGGTDRIRLQLDDHGLPALIQETFDIDAADAFQVEALDEARALTAALAAPTMDAVALALADLGLEEVVINRLRRVLVSTATLTAGRRTVDRRP